MRERALGTASKGIRFGRPAARPGTEPAGELARSCQAESLYTQALPRQSTSAGVGPGRGPRGAGCQDAL